jgi:SNF2 family DNA or RNA helicase
MAKFILQRAERQVETGEDIYAVRRAMEQLEKDGFTVQKGMHRNGDQVKASHILVLLLRLRQICCHMSLVKNVRIYEKLKDVITFIIVIFFRNWKTTSWKLKTLTPKKKALTILLMKSKICPLLNLLTKRWKRASWTLTIQSLSLITKALRFAQENINYRFYIEAYFKGCSSCSPCSRYQRKGRESCGGFPVEELLKHCARTPQG